MQLDSVRELKANLEQSVVEPMSTTLVTRRLIAIGARSIESPSRLHRTLALGITKMSEKEYRLAVRVQQRSLTKSRALDIIQEKARNEVDIRYVGRVVKRSVPWHQRRNRPLKIGGSISHYRVTGGTLGCFVKRGGNGAPHILSNNHVLADENRAKLGDSIIQPGAYDGGRRPADVIGKLEDFVKVKTRGINLVDCAVACVHEKLKVDATKLAGLGKLVGVSDVDVDEGERVAKVGRTTGVTRGRVTAFELDNLMIEFDAGDIRFDNQIEIEGDGPIPFSDGGDSGALIVNGDCRAVGLLFAGTDVEAGEPFYTYANPIGTVLEKLKIELVY
ncbi:MAG: hypothetical protein AB1646_23330 [Thermodesulfobacteriota bacterium]